MHYRRHYCIIVAAPLHSRRGSSVWLCGNEALIRAAIEEGVLTPATRFAFHDLRAFYATRHKAERGTLPDLHKNPETTARVCDRNKVVKGSAL
jgi:hypothetical protein